MDGCVDKERCGDEGECEWEKRNGWKRVDEMLQKVQNEGLKKFEKV